MYCPEVFLKMTTLITDRTCRLCNKSGALKYSHILPHFVFKFLKESSATGYLRSAYKPNKRDQDGPKEYMLCTKCEELFNGWETLVANEIFHPLHKNTLNAFKYGPWLLKFAVSVSWRALTWLRERNSSFHQSKHPMIDKALQTWQKFLLNHRSDPGSFEQHIILLDSLNSETTVDNLPPNINRYFLRAVDINVASSESAPLFIWIKMCRLGLIGLIHYEHPRHWQGTKIHVRSGTIGGEDILLPEQVLDYLKDRARVGQKANRNLSQKQKERIEKSYNKNMGRLENSETLRAMEEDVQFFGIESVFETH